MKPLEKHDILGRMALLERDEPSDVFGGTLRLRELARVQFRALQDASALAEGMIHVDRWYGGVFAQIVIDPATGQPMFTLAEILEWPERDDVWAEIRRIAELGMKLSEVGPEALKSGDPEADAE